MGFDVNTTSKYPTHFLRGVELIIHGRTKFGVPSENWPNPTEYKCGTPQELYYSEIWVDGMDWQPSYWVIEEKKLEKPQCQPFIIFESNEDREKFNDYDFEQLVRAGLWYRRDILWIKQDSRGIYNDWVWPYFKLVSNKNFNLVSNEKGWKVMVKCSFEHASQPLVEFWMNYDFISNYSKLLSKLVDSKISEVMSCAS